MKLQAIGIGDGVSFRVVNGSVFYQQLNALKGRFTIKDYSVEFLGYRIPEPNEQLQLI